MPAYYNEIEPYAAQWLRNLIKAGHIADGEVDTRSIVDVRPADLAGFTQAHFFAGIGGWSHALRLAGWPDDRPIWTGSCPCQPFSVAGKGAGVDDPRHLWPHFHRLITAVRPPVVMGEQVAGQAGYGWLDGVRADLERENYASRGVDIPACAVDAPHIRSRLYWIASDVAHPSNDGAGGDIRAVGDSERGALAAGPTGLRQTHRQGGADWLDARSAGDVGDANNAGLEGQLRHGDGGARREGEARPVAEAGGSHMADATHSGWREERADAGRGGAGDQPQRRPAGFNAGRVGRHMADADQLVASQEREQRGGQQRGSGGDPETRHSFWSDHIWLTGADGKARRAQPGIPLLAYGIPNRVGKLRAYGNAIVAPLAAQVIGAYLDAEKPYGG